MNEYKHISDLRFIHESLMYRGFPYHSVSVIYRQQDLGLHVFFMESVKDKVTEEVKTMLEIWGFNYSFVKE